MAKRIPLQKIVQDLLDGMSQTELASAAGCSQQYISILARDGTKRPSYELEDGLRKLHRRRRK